MAKTRGQKEKEVREIVLRLKRQKSFVVSGFSSVTVKDLEALRKDLRASGGEYSVAKKTFFSIAFKETGVPVPDFSNISQNCGLAFGYEDEIAPARIMKKFVKSHKACIITGGMIDGETLSAEDVDMLARIPSHAEVLRQIVIVLSAPLMRMQSVLTGNLRSFMYILNQIHKA